MHKTISLFTGAGGLDLGLEAAGFKTVVSIESNKWACRTLRKNRPNWNIIENEIQNVSSSSIINVTKSDEREISLLAGGPPCQPFSKAAYWSTGDTKRLKDPRAATLTEYLRVLKDVKPKAFLIENVLGITYKGKDETIYEIKKSLGEINRIDGCNYSFNLGVLNSANFGVPQSRERVFIIGSREGRLFKFPEPTHFNPSELINSSKVGEHWLTAWDAIGDLNFKKHLDLGLRGKWAALLPSIPEGKNYLFHTNRGGGVSLFGWRRRYWNFLLKLAKDRPSWTISAQPGSSTGPFHWSNRRLSKRELCRIQTFPDSYNIEGEITEAQRQIGNAVPCLLSEILGKEIKKQFFGEKECTGLKMLQKKNTTTVPKSSTLAVPESYRELMGDHPDHPGVSMGPLFSTKK